MKSSFTLLAIFAALAIASPIGNSILSEPQAVAGGLLNKVAGGQANPLNLLDQNKPKPVQPTVPQPDKEQVPEPDKEQAPEPTEEPTAMEATGLEGTPLAKFPGAADPVNTDDE